VNAGELGEEASAISWREGDSTLRIERVSAKDAPNALSLPPSFSPESEVMMFQI